MSARRSATALCVTVLVSSIVHLVHDAVAFAINPDFGLGAAAHTEKVLGVDYNGWHALTGFVVFGPGLVLWRRVDQARAYALAVCLGLLATAFWGLLDTSVGVLTLPDRRADAIFHVGSALVYVLVLLADAMARATDPGVRSAR